jgi:O-antigen ligase
MIIGTSSSRAQSLFFSWLTALCIAFGFDFWTYFFLYSSGLLGLFILTQAWRSNNIEISWQFYIPILFFTYLVITPGNPLKDLHVAGIFNAAFFAGAAGWLLFHDRVHTILFVLPASLTAHFLVSCVWTLLFGDPLLGTSGNPGRLALAFSHPNVLGELSALGIFFLLSFPHPNRNARYTGYGLMAILSLMIVLSVSRSTYLGMASAIFIFAIIRSWKKALASVVILLAIGFTAFPLMPNSEQQRIMNAFRAPLEDPTFQSRRPIWGLAYQKITEAPFFGHGLRTFKGHYQEHLDNNFDKLKAENPHTEFRYFKHPHSIYLAAMYGWGIVGTILLVVCWGMAVRYGRQQGHHLMLYVTAFMLGLGLFDVRFLSRDGAFFLFFPIGMAFSHTIRRKAHLTDVPISFSTPPDPATPPVAS